jgi:cytochrome c oxidase subunit 4
MSDHLTPPSVYYRVFAGLIALTLLTVAVSFLELGAWHTTVGVLIGVVKASLVALFFMHLLHSPKSSWLAALAGLFWFGIMMVLTLTDYISRPILSY